MTLSVMHKLVEYFYSKSYSSAEDGLWMNLHQLSRTKQYIATHQTKIKSTI